MDNRKLAKAVATLHSVSHGSRYDMAADKEIIHAAWNLSRKADCTPDEMALLLAQEGMSLADAASLLAMTEERLRQLSSRK